MVLLAFFAKAISALSALCFLISKRSKSSAYTGEVSKNNNGKNKVKNFSFSLVLFL